MNDYAVTEAMMIYGGSFVRALGQACRAADPENLARVKLAFADYWIEYTGIAANRAAAITRREAK